MGRGASWMQSSPKGGAMLKSLGTPGIDNSKTYFFYGVFVANASFTKYIAINKLHPRFSSFPAKSVSDWCQTSNGFSASFEMAAAEVGSVLCGGCCFLPYEIIKLCYGDSEAAVQFLVKHGVLKQSLSCAKCGKNCNFCEKQHLFYCSGSF